MEKNKQNRATNKLAKNKTNAKMSAEKTGIDRIFLNNNDGKFSFNKEVASVFDDMIERSVPYYRDNIELIAKILQRQRTKIVCDIGCSTGNLLLNLARFGANANLSSTKIAWADFAFERLVGIDNSPDMIDVARNKASAYGLNLEFILGDILSDNFSEILRDLRCDAAILNYTLQFIRPMERENVLKKIHNSLNERGILIVSEKLVCKEVALERDLIEIYYDFKQRNGYSNTEIAKKREALENVLIPYTHDENVLLFKNAGFRHIEMIFRWANFATFVAMK